MRADLLELRTVEVLPPALEAKISIARNARKLDTLPRELEPLLSAVTTGLEAHLVGVVGRRLPPTGSRFALFDTYSRTRLGPDATAGITALSRIAGWLVDRLTFSLTVRDLDRLLDDGRIPSDMSIRLHRAGLLSSHGDRVSFAHELFLDAFAAEALVAAQPDDLNPSGPRSPRPRTRTAKSSSLEPSMNPHCSSRYCTGCLTSRPSIPVSPVPAAIESENWSELAM